MNMTPDMHTYLSDLSIKYAEVNSSDLRQGDRLIMFTRKHGEGFDGVRLMIIDEVVAGPGDRFVTVRSGEEEMKIKRGVHYAIKASSPNLINRKIHASSPLGLMLEDYKIVGQRPISAYPQDAHLIVVLANKASSDTSAPKIFGDWATAIYDDRKCRFVDEDFSLTYNEAMDDFSRRRKSGPVKVAAS
jgi:hypothetical protein